VQSLLQPRRNRASLRNLRSAIRHLANSLLGGLNLQAIDKGRLDVLLEEHELVQNLLACNGYRRVFETATQYDDWYVLAT
jgi:hypothetical protein